MHVFKSCLRQLTTAKSEVNADEGLDSSPERVSFRIKLIGVGTKFELWLEKVN